MQTESTIRRMAARGGYRIVKNRARNPDAVNFGGYMVIENDRNLAVLGSTPIPYSADLDEIRDWLTA